VRNNGLLTFAHLDGERFVAFNAVMICVFGAPHNGHDYLTVIVVAASGDWVVGCLGGG